MDKGHKSADCFGAFEKATCLWVKNRYPKWNPGKWKRRLTSAVLLWFNFDPYPHVCWDDKKKATRSRSGLLVLRVAIELQSLGPGPTLLVTWRWRWAAGRHMEDNSPLPGGWGGGRGGGRCRGEGGKGEGAPKTYFVLIRPYLGLIWAPPPSPPPPPSPHNLLNKQQSELPEFVWLHSFKATTCYLPVGTCKLTKHLKKARASH